MAEINNIAIAKGIFTIKPKPKNIYFAKKYKGKNDMGNIKMIK